MRSIAILTALIFLGLTVSSPVMAAGHEYAGAKKCSICHKTPAQGEQFKIWQNSRHSHAFETLGTPQAKEVAAKMGIDNPQTSGKCLKCHATSYGFTETQISKLIPVAEGVSCESCHGAGKDYSKMTVMKNRDQAIAAGLVVPDEALCLKCHNQESPTFKPFNYQERSEAIKHPIPAKK